MEKVLQKIMLGAPADLSTLTGELREMVEKMCLLRKEYAKIPGILDHKFDLQLLYPKRNRFHIAEVVNFMGLLGLYFYEIHDLKTAQKYNKMYLPNNMGWSENKKTCKL